MGDDNTKPGLLGHGYSIQRFGQGTDLVDLDQDGITRPFVNSALEPGRIGDEEIITHQLHVLPHGLGQAGKPGKAVFIQRVFDRHNRVTPDHILPEGDHLILGQCPALTRQTVIALVMEFTGRCIQGEHNIITRRAARLFDCLEDEIHGLGGGTDGRGKPALITNRGGKARIIEQPL